MSTPGFQPEKKDDGMFLSLFPASFRQYPQATMDLHARPPRADERSKSTLSAR